MPETNGNPPPPTGGTGAISPTSVALAGQTAQVSALRQQLAESQSRGDSLRDTLLSLLSLRADAPLFLACLFGSFCAVGIWLCAVALWVAAFRLAEIAARPPAPPAPKIESRRTQWHEPEPVPAVPPAPEAAPDAAPDAEGRQ